MREQLLNYTFELSKYITSVFELQQLMPPTNKRTNEFWLTGLGGGRPSCL